MEKDVFDYLDEDVNPKSRSRAGIIWNLMTIMVILTAACIGVYFATVFLNPNIGINPFPPPATPIRIELDTPTPTPIDVLPPTWTPTEGAIAVETLTPAPSETPLPTEESQVEEEADDEIQGDMPVILHEGSPQYIPSSGWHPDLGCNWMGVAGQVIDINGAPVQGLIIEVGGTLRGKNIGDPSILQATGLATAYGDAGYEVKLADEPVDSNNTIWIQVLDQAGLPLSNKIRFNTYNDCEKNLVIIYFKQVR